jgi:hypothetical protein
MPYGTNIRGTPETSLMVKSLNPAWGGVAQSAKP